MEKTANLNLEASIKKMKAQTDCTMKENDSLKCQLEYEMELRKELERDFSDTSLLGAARKILDGDELDQALGVLSLGNIGQNKESVDDLCQRRKSDMGNVISMIIGKVIRIAFTGKKQDPRKILATALNRRDAVTTTLGMALLQAKGDEHELQSKLALLSPAYQSCVKSGDKLGGKRILSIAADIDGITDNEVARAFSEDTELKVGDRVRVAVKGNRKITATLRELADSNGNVLVSDHRGVDGNVVKDQETRVNAERVWVCGSVRVTVYEVREARTHAREKYPGAEADAEKNPHNGISKERAEYVAGFLRRSDNVKVTYLPLSSA